MVNPFEVLFIGGIAIYLALSVLHTKYMERIRALDWHVHYLQQELSRLSPDWKFNQVRIDYNEHRARN